MLVHGAALVEAASRARHDLGKYIGLQSRWLPENCTIDARREALIADLRHTRSGPAGVADAVTVWAECQAALTAAAGGRKLPEVEQIEARMRQIAGILPRIEQADVHELQATANLAREVGDLLRDLHRRLLREEGE